MLGCAVRVEITDHDRCASAALRDARAARSTGRRPRPRACPTVQQALASEISRSERLRTHAARCVGVARAPDAIARARGLLRLAARARRTMLQAHCEPARPGTRVAPAAGSRSRRRSERQRAVGAGRSSCARRRAPPTAAVGRKPARIKRREYPQTRQGHGADVQEPSGNIDHENHPLAARTPAATSSMRSGRGAGSTRAAARAP